MRIRAGKYTLALTMVSCGVLMLINTVYGHGIFKNLWLYSPAVLILFGLEIIILNLVFGHRENYRVEVSVGSILLIIFVVAVFMMWTNSINFDSPYFRHIFDIDFQI